MASAGTYRRTREWLPGDSSLKSVDVGARAECNPELPSPLGLLCVGYLGSVVQERVIASISPGDDGTLLSPIDVPFALVLPQPMRVELRPVGAPTAAIRLVVSVSPVCGNVQSYATFSQLAPIGSAVELPQWVRSVTVLAPGVARFRTRGGAAIVDPFSGFAERPALAADLLMTVGGYVVLNY